MFLAGGPKRDTERPKLDLRRRAGGALEGTGYCIGAAIVLVQFADLAVAAENAVFSLPEPRVGLAALGGGIHRLPREIGIKKAMGMLLTGRRVSAQEGKDLGFVNEVSRKNSVLDTAKDWAGLILECAPLSVRASKEAAMLGMNASGIEDAIKSRYKQVQLMQKSSDFVEGPRAFSEKRAPIWSGV